MGLIKMNILEAIASIVILLLLLGLAGKLDDDSDAREACARKGQVYDPQAEQCKPEVAAPRG